MPTHLSPEMRLRLRLNQARKAVEELRLAYVQQVPSPNGQVALAPTSIIDDAILVMGMVDSDVAALRASQPRPLPPPFPLPSPAPAPPITAPAPSPAPAPAPQPPLGMNPWVKLLIGVAVVGASGLALHAIVSHEPKRTASRRRLAS